VQPVGVASHRLPPCVGVHYVIAPALRARLAAADRPGAPGRPEGRAAGLGAGAAGRHTRSALDLRRAGRRVNNVMNYYS